MNHAGDLDCLLIQVKIRLFEVALSNGSKLEERRVALQPRLFHPSRCQVPWKVDGKGATYTGEVFYSELAPILRNALACN